MALRDDPFNLRRFVDAQDPLYDGVLAELRAGRKTSHWMWFVFPQLRGLGVSPTAWHYGIASIDEATAYLRHPVLGPRLRECTRLVNAVQGLDTRSIFGSPDDVKFRSSMSLFDAVAADEEDVFSEALRKYFGGQPDPRTRDMLRVR